MSKLLPTLFLMTVFLIAWLVLYAHQRNERKKRELPLREDFRARPGTSGPACHACGKDELPDDGLASGNDEQRIVSCVSCNTLLYRYERAPEPEPAS